MFQPRHAKKWTRSEKWLLGLSLPALVALSWWSFRQPDQSVPVGKFKVWVAKPHFTKEARPTMLRPTEVAYARRETRFNHLIPLRFSFELTHDGPRPAWWGHATGLWVTFWLVSKRGVLFDSMAKKTRLRFDPKSQHYIVGGEMMVADDLDYLDGACCVGKGVFTIPLRYVNTYDASTPTTLQHAFKFATNVKLD